MGHESVDIHRNLTSYYASLYVSSGEPILVTDVCQSASRMRRNYGDAVAHHSTHNTQHDTLTKARGARVQVGQVAHGALNVYADALALDSKAWSPEEI